MPSDFSGERSRAAGTIDSSASWPCVCPLVLVLLLYYRKKEGKQTAGISLVSAADLGWCRIFTFLAE
jgi:hypothetical protein